MTTSSEFIRRCLDEEVKFLDLKAVDLLGTLHHLTVPVKRVTAELISKGVGFDGSSYGFAKTENSDMVLIPDINTAAIDPFRDSRTMSVLCSIHLADSKRTRFDNDVRYVCEKSEKLLKDLEIADVSQWGPEFEFNIFEDVDFDVTPENAFYAVNTSEAGINNAYHACNPVDQFADFRDMAVELMEAEGIGVRYHHHEVGTFGQQEIECIFNDILTTGDNSVMTRYLLKNLAYREGLALTFMPKPIIGQAGNGWHLHQFLTQKGTNIFYQKDAYAQLSKKALNYIGGVLTHGPSIMAFTNPSTNSYKRLVPGYEAPVALSYGQANRAGALRIPKYVTDPNKVRVEYRPPDATCNPYLCMASILMAGIDGIINEIDPVEAGFGPYDGVDPHSSDYTNLRMLPRTLYDALDALEQDNDFLKRGGVFDSSLLENWVAIKRDEVKQYLLRPHPYEYDLYFDF